ncbi:uncharacterized protein LOC113387953 [Ctenocephalides felis]|uniref:uncharacterized protein LOC113387953 n=1 Tax=Ctenocephalides felis TaxID=7515 RepID=UPI000E6E21C5|nr:uncharacterized protein LOC113387953 [Ctenocephalides felis]
MTVRIFLKEIEQFRKIREESKTEYLNSTHDFGQNNSFTMDQPSPVPLPTEKFYDTLIEKMPLSYENNKLAEIKELVEGNCSFPKLIRSKSNLKKRINISTKNDTLETSLFHSSVSEYENIDLSLNATILKPLEEHIEMAKDKSEKFVTQFGNIDLVKDKLMNESDSEKLCNNIKEASRFLSSLRQYHEESKSIEESAKKISSAPVKDNDNNNSIYKELTNELIAGMEEIQQLVNSI